MGRRFSPRPSDIDGEPLFGEVGDPSLTDDLSHRKGGPQKIARVCDIDDHYARRLVHLVRSYIKREPAPWRMRVVEKVSAGHLFLACLHTEKGS